MWINEMAKVYVSIQDVRTYCYEIPSTYIQLNNIVLSVQNSVNNEPASWFFHGSVCHIPV